MLQKLLLRRFSSAALVFAVCGYVQGCGVPAEDSTQEGVSVATQAATASPACAPLPSGAVAWWPGDGNADDITGSHSGPPRNRAGFAQGLVAEAFSFVVPGDVAQVPDSPELNLEGLTSSTFEGWFSSDSAGPSANGRVVIAKHTCGLPRGWFFATDEGCFVGDHHIGGVGIGGLNVDDRKFHHFACVKDGSSYREYIDGQLVSADTGPTLGTPVSESIQIGSLDTGTCSSNPAQFSGLVDELTLYESALTTDQVQAIVAADRAGKCRPLKLPWTAGETWSITSGPHEGGDAPLSALKALDFAPATGCSQKVGEQFWVRAAASGKVTKFGKASVHVQHPDGTSAVYCHVTRDDTIALNTPIAGGQRLGHPSCEACEGETQPAGGMHVHFYRYRGDETQILPLPADGLSISGWRVNRQDSCRRNGERRECGAVLTKPGEADRRICPKSGVLIPGAAALCVPGPTDLLSDNESGRNP